MEDNKSLEQQDRERGIVGRYMSFGRDLEYMWENAVRDADGNLAVSYGERLPYEVEIQLYASEIRRDLRMLEDYKINGTLAVSAGSQVLCMVTVFKSEYWHQLYLVERENMEREMVKDYKFN